VGYAAGLSLMPDEANHDFFMDAADAIFNAYGAVVEKRKDSPCSQEQLEQMNRFRSEWVRFTFMNNRFFQGGVSLGVPPQSFMQHMLPPSVRF
jgi:coproporphyrinogen III oxidase